MRGLKRQGQSRIYKWLSAILICAALAGSFPAGQAQAASKKLSLAAAKSMALAQSSDYTKLKNRLALAKVQYTQSVKSIKLKEKNQKTFRWSPLLSFKFPEKPDLADQFEYTYKPLELQSQIDEINHSITDCVYGVYEEVSLCFVEVYVLQEKIAFHEKRIASYESALSKNKARLITGLASQTDIDTAEKKLETLNATLASDRRSFEAEKEKLGELIGIDVSTSYEFQSPFVSADLSRTIEDQLIVYTLEHDDAYYQAKLASANGLLQLNTNYSLMQKQYGSSKMRLIDSFVSQAKRGEKLDSAAFKLKYGELLDAVDKPWQGKKRILFIRIPKEWFKGAIDGIRYVEDEPYALYESAVEYQTLHEDEQAMKKELTASVKSSYENYVSTKNTSGQIEKEVSEKETELQKAAVLNGVGSMTYEEYAQVQEEYEDLQMDLLEARSAYSQTLYSLDRLTCGAVSPYLKGTSITMSSAQGGLSYAVEEGGAEGDSGYAPEDGSSYVVEDEGEGIYYYIHSMVENNVFELGISVPDGFEPSVTQFELWIDGVQVGKRTASDQTIRHLALDIDEVERVFIRLYDGETFVDDCDIDPSVYSDKLLVKTYRIETSEDDRVGTYTAETNAATGLLELTITPDADQGAASYNIKTEEGVYLVGGKKNSVKEKFRYLVAAESSLDDLTICFYDEEGLLICEAHFRSADGTIRKNVE